MNAPIHYLRLSLAFLGAAAVVPADAAPMAPPSSVRLDASLGQHVLLSKHGPQTAYLKVGLTGARMPGEARRPGINLALVLDRSSSMSGEKIVRAKEAALMVIDRLRSDDILSVISYDDRVDVLVPATKVSDKEVLRARVRTLSPRGSTALFAGVSRGIEEVRKFLDPERVNRVVLLSDGQANVGPSSPNELGRLGASARKQGISITTVGLGLGYNEDLMVQLAKKSDGNHSFVEHAQELAALFERELGDVVNVVAQELTLKVDVDERVKPIRVLNQDSEIHGQQVILQLNQLYARQERYFLIELQTPSDPKTNALQELAWVSLSYSDMATQKIGRASYAVGASFSESEVEVARAENGEVMVQVVEALAIENNRNAVALRDKGNVAAAEKALKDNAGFLGEASKKYGSKKLDDYRIANETAAKNLAQPQWNKQRKGMRQSQLKRETQATY